MSSKHPGEATRDFMRRGFKSFAPRGAAPRAAIIALMLGVALTTTSVAAPTFHPQASNSAQTRAPTELDDSRLGAADVMADQTALRRIVARAAAQAATPVPGYKVPDLERLMLSYLGMAQSLNPSDAGGLYGLDDGKWAWMMRNFAKATGVGSAMDGIRVNDDASIDARSAADLAAMLNLRRNPVVASKVFAAWYASEIADFDGQMGRAPNAGEKSIIALIDSERARIAATLLKRNPSAKLAPALGVRAGNWQRPLFTDSKGWMSTQDAMASMEARMASEYSNAFSPIPLRKTETPILDEDLTTADLRSDPERLVRIVVSSADELPDASREFLDRTFAKAGIDTDETTRTTTLGIRVVSIAAMVDEVRGDDVAGDFYAFGERQWIDAVMKYGDPTFKESFASGVSVKADGSVHAVNADQIGTLLRLREHTPIATQIMLSKTASDIAALQTKCNRMPSDRELFVSHLFGVEAAAKFAKCVDAGAKIDAPQFSESDPRSKWNSAIDQYLHSPVEPVDDEDTTLESLQRRADADATSTFAMKM